MTTEELLKPRYKVIGDYPGNYRKVGDIFSAVGDSYSIKYWCAEKDKYPHLFQRLHWADNRKVEDMPEYVRHEHGWIDKHIGVNHAGDCFVFIGRNDTIEWAFKHFQPATEADYLAYLQTTTQLNDGQ